MRRIFGYIIATLFTMTTAISGVNEKYKEQQEAIPVDHVMSKDVLDYVNKYKLSSLEFNQIIQFFAKLDERKSETDVRYILLNMETHKGQTHKGTGTALYFDGDYLLLITAYHNIDSPSMGGFASKIHVKFDSKDVTYPYPIGSTGSVISDHVKIPGKDIALLVIKINPVFKDNFKKDEVLYKIRNIEKLMLLGNSNKKPVKINQYPAYSTKYYKISGEVYYDYDYNNPKVKVGYSNIPTLPGSSGSAVIYDESYCYLLIWCYEDEKIIGVHVRAGEDDPSSIQRVSNKETKRQLILKNNIFELISTDELEALKTSNITLSSLIKKYTGENKKHDL